MKSYKLLLISVLTLMTVSMTGCSEPKQPLYPIKDIPPEFQDADFKAPDIVNSSALDNVIQDSVRDDANDILAEHTFNVYYDNSTGCFMQYTSGVDPLMLEIFQKNMRSFRSVYECAASYQTYTTQADAERKTPSGSPQLVWKPFSGNVFDDYAQQNIYTINSGGDYHPDQPPLMMWLDEVQKHMQEGSLDVDVYMSDLNEQNGGLAKAGMQVKEILKNSQDPNLDFMIISYVLPYTGEISGYSLGLDGRSADKDLTLNIDGVADRHYYALAFGDRIALAALKYKVSDGFKELETSFNRDLQMTAYQYYDVFCNETEQKTLDKSGNIMETDYVTQNPYSLSLVDHDGNPVDTAQSAADPETGNAEDSGDLFAEDKADVFGEQSAKMQVLKNLSLVADPAPLFQEQPKGENYIFRYELPVTADNGWEASVVLNNADKYSFDISAASAYVYVPAAGSDIMADETAESGWVKINSGDHGIQLLVSDDKITVSSETMLAAQDGSTPVVAVSVPIQLPYTLDTKRYEIKNTDQTFIDWVNDCTVPQPLTVEYELLTRTAFFDEFIDKIVSGYKNISETGQRKPAEEQPEPVNNAVQVGRVNLIFVSDDVGK